MSLLFLPLTKATPKLLPPEMFQEISLYLAPPDVLSLSLMSHYLYRFLQPILYHSLDLKSSQCRHVLRALLRRPHLARYIRKLVLRPSYHYLVSGMTSDRAKKKEAVVLRVLHDLIPSLRFLHTFVWDGIFSPGPIEDSIWLELKLSCPKLRNVGSVLGWREAIDPHTELFKFENLKGFSLIPKYRELDAVSMTDCPSAHEFVQLPESLCDMLSRNSPNLEYLTIGCPTTSCNERVFDLRPLIHAYWPSLKSLTLGQTCISGYESSEDTSPSTSGTTFTTFINRHWPTLKRLSIPRDIDNSEAAREHSYPSITFDSVTSSLERYAGPLALSMNLMIEGKAIPFRLKDLSLCSKPLGLSDLAPLMELLDHCPTLLSLAIWVDFTQDASSLKVDHTGALESVLNTFPGLRHLDIRCSTQRRRTFRAIDIHQALSNLRSLKTFQLTKVSHKSRFHGADEMLETALRIVRFTPSASTLQKINLCYAWKTWNNYDTIGIVKMGKFDVVRSGGSPLHVAFIKAEERNQEYLEAHLGEYRAANILTESVRETSCPSSELEGESEMYSLRESITSVPPSRLSALTHPSRLRQDFKATTHTSDCHVPHNGGRGVCVCPHRRYIYDSACPPTPGFGSWEAPSPPSWATVDSI